MSRVALVTGAGRGIGAATVAALVAEGWRVVAFDRAENDRRLAYPLSAPADLEAIATAAGSDENGPRALAVRGDAACEPDLTRAVEAADGLGELDAVVAVAGAIAGGASLWELPAEQIEAMLELNLGTAIATARVGVPALLRRPVPRDGRFVAVASAAATRGMPGLAAYSAAKAGVTGLVRGLAADLAGSGVTANAISPGSTRTAMLEESARLYGLGSVEEFAAQQPLGRLLEPAEVAAAVAWLLGRGASGLTGADIPLDGGLSL